MYSVVLNSGKTFISRIVWLSEQSPNKQCAVQLRENVLLTWHVYTSVLWNVISWCKAWFGVVYTLIVYIWKNIFVKIVTVWYLVLRKNIIFQSTKSHMFSPTHCRQLSFHLLNSCHLFAPKSLIFQTFICWIGLYPGSSENLFCIPLNVYATKVFLGWCPAFPSY